MSFGWSIMKDSGYLSTLQTVPSVPYITTNLFLNLDANSYSGSGTTWADLSSNGRNATLINAPTYNSANGGYFHFTDTSFQYAVTAAVPSISDWTLEAWYRPTKSLTGKVTAVACNEFTTVLNYSLGNNFAPTSYNLCGGYYNGGWIRTTGLVPTLNTWYQGVVTYDGSTVIQYSNAVSQSTVSSSASCVSGGGVRIARRWDLANNDAANFFDGDISIVRIYSVALNSSQILQNFNAVRNRYGI